MNLTGITRSSFPHITRVCDFILLIAILLAAVLYFKAEVNASLAPGIDILSWTMMASLPWTRAEVIADNAFLISALETASIMPTNFRRPGEVEKDLGVKPAGLMSISLPTT